MRRSHWVLIGLVLILGVLVVRAFEEVERAHAVPPKEVPDVVIELIPVARIPQPVDIQFFPGSGEWAVVLEQSGTAHRVSVRTGATRPLFQIEVAHASELGLLGIAFHPRFSENGLFYVNSTPAEGELHSEISEWRLDPAKIETTTATKGRVLLEVDQPYRNHNAGQLAFGPDGFLYVGFGDGGSANDPKGHGQNPKTFLGSMLRIDVDGSHDLPKLGDGFRRGKYGIPKDNPKKPDWPPETYAIGLRNPWRYSFDNEGRLFVADVGQSSFEEIDLVSAGDNLGWNRREGRHCFPPESTCSIEGLRDPIFEYGRELGISVTGGYVVPSGSLGGAYVFADFGSGNFFALRVKGTEVRALRLGRHPIRPSTFGLNRATGELFVADHTKGQIFRVEAR